MSWPTWRFEETSSAGGGPRQLLPSLPGWSLRAFTTVSDRAAVQLDLSPPTGRRQHETELWPPDIKVLGGRQRRQLRLHRHGQVVIGFLPGFDVTGKTVISVESLRATCPTPAGIRFVTERLSHHRDCSAGEAGEPRDSLFEPAGRPSDVYFARIPSGPWKSIGRAQTAQPFTIDTTTRESAIRRGIPVGPRRACAVTLEAGRRCPSSWPS